MADRWDNTTGRDSFRFFSPEQVDQILREGAKRGRAGSHAAIERILKLEPALERAELWKRIRQLKHPAGEIPFRRTVWSPDDDRLLRKGYEGGWAGKQQAVRELLKGHPNWRPHVIWKRAAKLGLVQRGSRRGQERCRHRWSEDDDRILLNLAGYKTSWVIGKILRRSANAVRSRLCVLGKSSRVHEEGYARCALAKELHLGRRTIQRLIVEGLLEVRDPRVTRKSLDDLRKSASLVSTPLSNASERGSVSPGPEGVAEISQRVKDPRNDSSGRSLISAKSSRAKRVWAEAARTLNVSVEAIEKFIAQGVLKLYDPRITEKSFRNFCGRYGSLINYDSLNRETRDWLQRSMDFVRNAGEPFARRFQAYRKQAQVVRTCAKCGKDIRGNVFFRHIKECGQANSGPTEMASLAKQTRRNRAQEDR